MLRARDDRWEQEMSNPTRIGQEASDLKAPSSPSRITPTRMLDDDAEHQMTKSEPPAPKYPYAVDENGVARVGFVAVDPAQHNKATELQLWPLFGSKLTFARPHMRAFHFQWLSFFVAFMAWFASVWNHAMASVNLHAVEPTRNLIPTLGINIRGAGSLFRNDMDSTIERRARGDDDDDSFHTASALTPSSIIMASLP